MTDNFKVLYLLAYAAADSKKANDIKILNVRDISPITDYFVICSAPSTVQVKAIADEVEDKLVKEGFNLYHKEGYSTGRWVLLDFGDVIIHVFHEEDRAFYNIEKVWVDGEVINITL